MRSTIRNIPRWALLVITTLGAAWIIASSLVYFDVSRIAPFMIEKLPLRFEALWLFSLRVHVAAAMVSLPLCIALMTRPVQRRPRAHRWLGRLAGLVIVFALVPSGFVLSLEAKGGLFGTLGFMLSGAIVAFCMISGALAARRRDMPAHKRMMSHVFAQMSVAVSSRIMLVGFAALEIDHDSVYLISLWVPVLASAVLAELTSSSPRSLIERSRRAASSIVFWVSRCLGLRLVDRLGGSTVARGEGSAARG